MTTTTGAAARMWRLVPPVKSRGRRVVVAAIFALASAFALVVLAVAVVSGDGDDVVSARA